VLDQELGDVFVLGLLFAGVVQLASDAGGLAVLLKL
jgi:hypothetical protein